MFNLRSQYLPIAFQLSNGSCKIRYRSLILLLSINYCMLIIPMPPFSTPKQQTFLSIWSMSPPQTPNQSCYFFYIFFWYSPHLIFLNYSSFTCICQVSTFPNMDTIFHLIYYWFPYLIILYIITMMNAKSFNIILCPNYFCKLRSVKIWCWSEWINVFVL